MFPHSNFFFPSYICGIWSWFRCCYLWPWNLISWNVASLICISWTWVVEEMWPLLFGCWNQNVSPMIPIIKHWLKFNQFLLCGSCFTLWSRWKTKHGILCVKSYLLGHWQWQTYSHMKWPLGERVFQCSATNCKYVKSQDIANLHPRHLWLDILNGLDSNVPIWNHYIYVQDGGFNAIS